MLAMASPAIVSRPASTHSRSHTLTPSRLQYIEAAPIQRTPQRQLQPQAAQQVQQQKQVQQTPQQRHPQYHHVASSSKPNSHAGTPTSTQRPSPLYTSIPKSTHLLTPAKAQCILQTTSFHRQFDDYRVLHFPLYTSTLHHTSPFTPRPPPTSASESRLGLWDRLPLELQCLLLRSLSLRSLYAFRSTSTTARLTVHHLPEYHFLLTHTPGLLRAVLKTDTTNSFTLPELYAALVGPPDCVTCENYASFYSLTLHRRVCLDCLENAPELAVISLDEAHSRFSLLPEAVGSFIPVVKTLAVHNSVRTVSALHAKALKEFPAQNFPGKQSALTNYIDELLNYARKDELHRLDVGLKDSTLTVLPARQSQRTVLGRTETEKDSFLRRMTCVPLPWLNVNPNTKLFDSVLNPYGTTTPTPELEVGVVCTACSVVEPKGEADARVRRRVWTNEGFLRHWEGCVEGREWSRGILLASEAPGSVFGKFKRYLDECKLNEATEVRIY